MSAIDEIQVELNELLNKGFDFMSADTKKFGNNKGAFELSLEY
jgi:hypothetical protein